MCGITGHVDELCDHFFMMATDVGSRHQSLELQPELRPTTTGVSTTKYLRGDKAGPYETGSKIEIVIDNKDINEGGT